MRSEDVEIVLEEPDVTPQININLVLMVFTLILATFGAKLLPMIVPKAEKTEYVEAVEAVAVTIAADRSYAIGDETGLSREAIGERIREIEDGKIVLVKMAPDAKYDSLVWVVDRLMERPSLRVAFGLAGPAASAVIPAAVQPPAEAAAAAE